MHDLTLLAGIFLSSYTGFLFLAIPTRRHWRDLTSQAVCPTRIAMALRLVGSVALALSFALSLWRDGPSFGALLWVLLLSLAAFTVVATLAWWVGKGRVRG